MMRKPNNNKPAITGLMALFFLFILSISCLASADWQQYQKYDFKSGAQDTSYYGDWNSTGTYSELGFGNTFQPIVSDWDNDSTTELIGSQNNILYIYTLSSTGILTLENSFNMGATQDSQGYMFDNVSNKLLIIGFGTTMYSISYNGSALNIANNATLNSASISGVTCIKLGGGQGCYWTSGTNLTESNPLDLSTMTQTHNYTGHTFQTTQSPVMIDSDQDGEFEIIVPSRTSVISHQITVIDRGTLSLDTSFSSDGLFTVPGATGDTSDSMQLLSYNLVQGFGTEICALYQGGNMASAYDIWITCLDYAGNVLLSSMIEDDTGFGGTPGFGNIFLADVDNVNGFDVCGYGVSEVAGTHINHLICYNGWGGTFSTVFSLNFLDTYFGVSTSDTFTSADMNNDGKDDLIAGNYIFFSNGTTSKQNITISSSTTLATSSIPVDMNNDNILDVCGQTTSETFCAVSIGSSGTGVNGSNGLPELWGNYGVGFDNPVCKGTTIRFSALQDSTVNSELGLPLATGTNYFNDVPTDTERFYGSCGTGTTITGSYSLTTPYVDCDYNNTGTYYPTLCLLDQANTALSCLSGAINGETRTIYVIDGVPGVTCNIQPVPINPNVVPPAVTDPTNTTQVQDYATSQVNLGIVTFIQFITDYWKILLGFLLWAGVTIGVAVFCYGQPHGGLVTGIVSLITFVILSIATLFPIWILVLLCLMLALIFAIVLFLKGK